MKKLYIITIVIVVLAFPLNSMSKNYLNEGNRKPVYTKILEKEGIEYYRIPAFIVRFALKNTEESEDITPFLKGSRYINFAICENNLVSCNESFANICNRLNEFSYFSLVDINDGKSKIAIKSLFDKNMISELVILIVDDTDFVTISMTGRIDPKEISDAIIKLNKTKSNKN